MKFIQNAWIAYCLLQVLMYRINCEIRQLAEGSTAVLRCPIQPVLLWRDKEEKTIFFVNQTFYEGVSSRMKITDDYVFIIRNISSMDERTYRCEGINKEGFMTAFDFTLQIKKGPRNMRIENLTNPEEVFANEGEYFQLTCSVDSGIPAEKMQWLLGERTVAVGGPGIITYSFTPQRSNDKQHFTCLAFNDFSIISVKVRLRINYRPVLRGPSRSIYSTQLGKEKQFMFKVEADPKPTVEWVNTAGGELGIWNLSKYHHHHHPLYNETYTLKSRIKPTKKEHFGIYSAKISNNIGSIEMFLQLNIEREPRNMRIQNLSNPTEVFANEEEMLLLTCTVDSGKPAETMTWLSNGRIVLVGGPGILTYNFIPKRVNDGQNLTCMALNDVSTTSLQTTVILRLYFKPKVHVTAYPSTNVDEGKRLKISCIYESNVVHDDIYWYRFSYRFFNISSHQSFNLVFSNLSKEDRGNYYCVVKNRVGIAEANITVTVNFQPTIIGSQINKFSTQLEKATQVVFNIESYPKPSVSWSKSAGGKLGVWKISEYSHLSLFYHIYCLESSILPAKEDHFGLYMAAIRNKIGSTDVSIQLQEARSVVIAKPQQTTCIASSSVNITCRNDDNNIWNVTWKHFFHGALVQIFKGTLDDKTAILSINHCDYRDGGDYVCEWVSDDTKLSGWSSISIRGPPVITQKNKSVQDELVFISVDFYCENDAFEIRWYINDVRLNSGNNDYHIFLEKSKISVRVHTQTINIDGFNSKLSFNRKLMPNINKLNCLIRQYIYSSEVIFYKDELQENLYTSVTSEKSETSVSHEVTMSTADNSTYYVEQVRPALHMHVLLVATCILILISVVIIFQWISRISKDTVPEQINVESADVPLQFGEINSFDDDHYDDIPSDIGSTYYHSAEWRNTSVDSDDSRSESSTSDELSPNEYNIDNIYEGVASLFQEPHHQYSGCVKMKRKTI